MIFPVIVFIVAVYVLNKLLSKMLDDILFRDFLSIMLAAICSLSIIGLSNVIIEDNIVLDEYNKTKVVSLTSSSELNGSVFLLVGSINNIDYYKFYTVMEDGGKVFNKILAKNAIIYEDNCDDAYISNVKEMHTYPDWIHTLFIPKFLLSDEKKGYAIHVPKGTIKTGFDIH